MVALSLQDFICEHYGEDSSVYTQEIKELMELRQVIEPSPSISFHVSSNLEIIRW